MINQHLYLRDSNAVVTWIQKNACTAVNASVAVANGIIPSADKFNWMYSHKSKATIEQIENAAYRFVIFREPLDRLISAFNDQVANKKRAYEKIMLLESIDNLSFSAFVDFLDYHNATRIDIHWTPQADFLLDNYDDIFILSDLAKANQILKEKIGFQINDIRGVYQYGTGNYSKTCSERIRDKIKRLYVLDYFLMQGAGYGCA